MAFNQTVNRFRTARGRVLRGQIAEVARHLGRSIDILDVGGRPDYWSNVGFDDIRRIELLNVGEEEFETSIPREAPRGLFSCRIGDARDLAEFADQSVDFVHSNSVIEHVGPWEDILSASREMRRVGRAGWVQTPAWEFPVEPHFHLPFVHWVGKSVGAAMLSVSPIRGFRELHADGRRWQVDHIHLLDGRRMRLAFPDAAIFTERVIVPKSYAARWMPEQAGAERAAEERAAAA